LNENWFNEFAEARERIARWKQDYNPAGTHPALADLRPAELVTEERLHAGTVLVARCSVGEPQPEKVLLSLG
jgi:hypothetical protein